MTEIIKKLKKYVVPFRLDEISYKYILRESKENKISISEYIRKIINNHIKTKQ